VTMWPVICPATRVSENRDREARGDTSLAHRVGAGFAQMAYWVHEDAMKDGSPMLALERGEEVDTPDILYVQAWCDTLHTRQNMERFCENYRRIGGHVEEEMMDGEPYDALRSAPDTPHARAAFARITGFLNGDRRPD
jgi:acetyl esterase